MSKEAHNSPNIEIPIYCDYSKFFLIEEIALQRNYHQLHYGHCCVIGKFEIDSSDPCNRFLENIRLPCLPKEFALPEGTLHLRLITNELRGWVPSGKICEVVGDIVLYNTVDKTANRVPLTSKDVVEKLNYLRSKNHSESEYLTDLLSIYQPAICVDHIKELNRGHELAERNFEIRMLLMK